MNSVRTPTFLGHPRKEVAKIIPDSNGGLMRTLDGVLGRDF